MNRTIFVADGFNLYHSLIQAQKDAGGASSKWLNLKSLCSSYLPIVGRVSGERATLERIFYFSAPPTHRSQGKQDQHTLYMRCLSTAARKFDDVFSGTHAATCSECSAASSFLRSRSRS